MHLKNHPFKPKIEWKKFWSDLESSVVPQLQNISGFTPTKKDPPVELGKYIR